MADNVNTSLEKFLSLELLTLQNEWFCPSCNSCTVSIKDTSNIQSAPTLVIHLKRFCVERDKVIKDYQFFKCLPEDLLEIRISALWWPQLTTQAVWTIDIIGQLWKMLPQTNDSLAMIKLSLKLKLKHMCSSLWEKNLDFSFFAVVFMQAGFVNSDIVNFQV